MILLLQTPTTEHQSKQFSGGLAGLNTPLSTEDELQALDMFI